MNSFSMMTQLENRCLFSAGHFSPAAVSAPVIASEVVQPLDDSTAPLSGVLGGTLPYTAIAGQNPKILQRLLVTNNSDQPVDGYIQAQLYLYSNGAIDTDLGAIGSNGQTKFLNPYGETVLTYHVLTTPSDTPAGDYQIVAVITDPDGNVTYAYSGKTITISPPVIDLSGIFTKTLKPGKDGKTTVSFDVTNHGNVPADGQLSYDIDQSNTGTLTGATPITSAGKIIKIKAGKTSKVTDKVTLPAGTYDVVVDLDPQNAFGDVNLSNNVFSTGPVTVG